jgi:glutamate-1-semialdehyde 2,1-aminomutase
MPSIEMIRFVNSGTEATMSALRLARAFTGRDKIIKFAGGYHGHADGLLTKSGSGLATLSIPDSPGVPLSYAQNTLIASYNDTQAVEQLFQEHSEDIAAIILEPVAANMGVVPPRPGFLQELRELTHKFGALLIFDEVITGFRVAYGGAQALYSITPDLTCLGKIIGGGLPVGAYGGRREIMQMIAGIETIEVLSHLGVYRQLEHKASDLAEGIGKAATKAGISLQISRVSSLLTVFFTGGLVADYESAKQASTLQFNKFFHSLLAEGIYWPPSQFEAAFISSAHTDEDIQLTVRAAGKALSYLKK